VTSSLSPKIFIGTAGWSIPRASAHHFAGEGTHLQRYSRSMRCTEINSSFHRRHAAASYAKWASSTPSRFRFSIKLPREITHDLELRRTRLPLTRFFSEIGGLGEKRGPVLVQLPPSLAFDARVTTRFFDLVRSEFEGLVVCEPRHATWFSAKAEELLVRYQVARVAADPAPVRGAEGPGGWNGIVYFRLHGSPRRYWSRYDGEAIAGLAAAFRLIQPSVDIWCVFDNTASGAALQNAWELQTLLSQTRAAV
jgi:uncharacterized protein YecE (DUF72 family)